MPIDIARTKEIENQRNIIQAAFKSCEFFQKNIYPKSFVGSEKYVGGPHLNKWARMLQDNQHTCILAPRKHSKSFSIYAWLMWIHMTHIKQDLEILYISYKKELASYHIKNYKALIDNNPFFNQMEEISNAQGKATFRWPNGKIHTVEPEGILSFKRGRHPHIVILDDVLADPTTMLDLGVIEKINQRVKEEVISLPKEGGQIKIIGTAQTPVDFFFDMKNNPDFSWGMFPAIVNEKNKEVLWPQKFPYDRLMHIRRYETGEKGFQKEFLIKPVWSADSYFLENEIMGCVNNKLKCLKVGEKLKTKNEVGCGWDIGKHSHPSHISVFEFVPLSKGMNLAVQRFQVFLDGWDYRKQLEFMKVLIENHRIDYVNFDNTRGEMEGFYEKGEMDKSKFIPKNFNAKYKANSAAQFEKRVYHSTDNGEPSPLIQLLNDQRMINQILCVTNDLEAVQTSEGHGDAFWSIALALDRSSTGEFYFLEDPDNVTGLK